LKTVPSQLKSTPNTNAFVAPVPPNKNKNSARKRASPLALPPAPIKAS
jgi:hypothetical protein